MTGKISDVEKSFKTINKFSSNMVKISPSKSILSYQNGSALNSEIRDCATDEGMPAVGYPEDMDLPEEPYAVSQNLKSECLDLLRKKLISDLSLIVFSNDLENKLTKMEPIEITNERQSFIQKLVVQISQLTDAEKLLLYLKLPSSTSSPFDPLRQPLNPLGNRQEIQQTIVWIKTHLEEDSEISIPKQDVYDQYLKYCENVSMKPLSTADFGKVMKQVYPGVRPRRLGTRGNSRYCYSGMRNTCKLPIPLLPQSCADSSLSNGSGSDGTSFLTSPKKFKKVDKSKRKWKSATCSNGKSTATVNRSSSHTFDKDSSSDIKSPRKRKLEIEESDLADERESMIIKEEADLKEVKNEESSDNSFSAFEMNCGIGFYLKKSEKEKDDSASTSTHTTDLISQGISLEENAPKELDAATMQTLEQCADEQIKMGSLGTTSQEIPPNGDDQLAKVANNNHIAGKINGSANSGKYLIDKQKIHRGKTKKSPTKSFKKSYVPIQPKPVEGAKALSISFDAGQFSLEKKTESEGVTLCDESDSQEPEEEIARYFKHLDGNEINSGLVNEAVKSNIDGGRAKVVANPDVYGNGEDMLNQTGQNILRSQSCLEVQRDAFGLERRESVFTARSQSTVELPSTNDHGQQEANEAEPIGKKKKVSHLRILLEKSVADKKDSYAGFKNGLVVAAGHNSVMSNAQNLIMNPVGGVVGPDSHCFTSSSKPANGDLLKFNGLKILQKESRVVPRSPNTRTKYFSFTPISPGPQSPLKTSAANPFLSPRNTPILTRSKQNSHNDPFLSPSERKSASGRLSDSGKSGGVEYVFDFGGVDSKSRWQASPGQGSRPRSCSSTNFCRSKARKSVKLEFDRPIPKIQVLGQGNFSMNSPVSMQPQQQTGFPGESVSSGVHKFLENSKIAESDVGIIRSQSVPLNRMISESTWLPAQISSVYPGCFNSNSGKLTDVVLPASNTSKDVGAPFLTNNEISALGSEMFSADPPMAQLNIQYFDGDFNSEDTQSFSEEPSFSNKLGLNSGAAFEAAFTNDADPAMADNIKSYLPDFESLDNKSLVGAGGNAEDAAQTDRKLFKSVLYEGGNENLKDPVITSFKPVLMNEISNSPDLNFFGGKMNEDSQQLIEFFDFED